MYSLFFINKKGNTSFFTIYILKGDVMYIKKILENRILIILISCIVILIVFLLNFINKVVNKEGDISLNTITKTIETTTKENKSFYVDVKGESELILNV